MRKPFLIAIALIVAVALPASFAVAAARTKTVKVGDNWFVRDTNGVPKIKIKQNTTVKFSFVGDSPHNVFVYRGTKLKSESDVFSEGTYKKKFKDRGTFKIVCDIHGADDQSMKIVVKK